jgi:hypothetical protein
MSMNTPTAKVADAERDRLEIIQEMVADRGPHWVDGYKPGSLGCHELLDRTAMLADMVEQFVLAHPSCALKAEWYALAEQATACLRDLYQRVGAEHLNSEDAPPHNAVAG